MLRLPSQSSHGSRGRPVRAILVLAAGLAASAGWAGPAASQAAETWNTERALELVSRARVRRQQPMVDASLENYRADVTGHIYFFIDREENPEPVLLRSDQVALELYWAQPGQVKQVIQGMRSEEQFPIKDFRYYLDRYTVIQNGFDDVIRVGEGRDVRNVVHPLSEPGRGFYDFRLADSTTIRLPGDPEPIRVYEVQVRPRNLDIPGIIGSLYLEQARADLVRLAFTFTPASYLDPRNERVEVMLENALWQGEYWLPREQRLLVRRELPQFDIDVGTVIRATLTVDRYELNTDLPDGFFRGREVVLAGTREALADYDFEEGLFDGLDDVGLTPGTDPGTLDDVDVEAIAGSIIRQRYLRGVSRVRFFVPTGSDLLRFDRAHGLVTGGGVSVGLGQREVYGYAGYAWGSNRPLVQLGVQPAGRPRGLAWFGRAYLRDPVDLGLRPSAAGPMATASAALLGRDLRDVAHASGVELGLTFGDARTGRFRAAAIIEERGAVPQAATRSPLDPDVRFRPVPPLEDGMSRGALRLSYDQRASVGPLAVNIRPVLEVGTTDLPVPAFDNPALPTLDALWAVPSEARDGGTFARVLVDGHARWAGSRRRVGGTVRGTAGFNLGGTPYQHLWYLGGRNTLPGHPFHGYVGDRAAVVDLTLWASVVPRWLRLRLTGAAGWSALDVVPPESRGDFLGLADWNLSSTDGVATSVGAGFATLDGFLRLDYGFRTDTWDGALILSIDPSLWPFL